MDQGPYLDLFRFSLFFFSSSFLICGDNSLMYKNGVPLASHLLSINLCPSSLSFLALSIIHSLLFAIHSF